MGDLFDHRVLLVQQPGKVLADRAQYSILTGERELLAVAVETEGHSRRTLMSKALPDMRAFAVRSAGGSALLDVTKVTSEWITEVRRAGMGAALIGQIRTEGSRRHYTFLDDAGQTLAKATGDLGLKHFSLTDPHGGEFARVHKTWAGLTKELLTDADHYRVEFRAAVGEELRILTVMMPVVLDLTLYGPT
jgi:hypothetical protein